MAKGSKSKAASLTLESVETLDDLPPQPPEPATVDEPVEETVLSDPASVVVVDDADGLADTTAQVDTALSKLAEEVPDAAAFPSADAAWDSVGPAFAAEGVSKDAFDDGFVDYQAGVTELPAYKQQLNEAFEKWAAAKNNSDLAVAEKYAALEEYGSTARSLFHEHNLPLKHPEWEAVKAETRGWLADLEPHELRAIAAQEGFQYPLLVSGGNPNDTKKQSLVYWLDPAYEPASFSKQQIQQKALERFADLESGVITDHKGVTYQDVLADGPDAAAAAGLASPQHLQQAEGWTCDAAALAELEQSKPTFAATPAEWVEHNWKVAAAQPGDGITAEGLEQAKQNLHVPKTAHYVPDDEMAQLAQITGRSEEALRLAGHVERAKLLDPHTSVGEIQQLEMQYQQLAADLTKFKEQRDANVQLWQQFAADPSPENAKKLKEGWQAVDAQCDAMGVNLAAAHTKLRRLHGHSTPPSTVLPAFGDKKLDETTLRTELKGMPLGQLRTVAADLGMGDKAQPPATRAAVQNYIIGDFVDSSMLKSDAIGKVDAKVNPPTLSAPSTPPTPPTPPPLSSAEPGGPPTGKSKVSAPKVTGGGVAGSKAYATPWNKQLAALESQLSQGLAARADIPARDDAKIAAMQFTEVGGPGVSGGSHSTSGLVGEDGSKWFGKPYGSSGSKARVAAEAVASQVKEDLGVETVPVYARNVNGKPMAVQPIVEGSQTLTPDVGDLGQAEVNTVVRNHVADWLVGDHDGNEQNWLQTPSGGLVRCDHGQSFKFYGEDKPSPSWNPNENYGTPVAKRVLVEHKGGALPSGAQVDPAAALDVVQAAEATPSHKWRERLRPVAEAGAGNPDVTWANKMRQRVAKRDGVPADQVGTQQVVEEFLDVADERRQSVRAHMIEAFEDAGIDASVLRHLA